MAQYRYYAVDVISGAIALEVPLVGVEANRVLNSPGSFSASMPLAGIDEDDPVKKRALQQSYWDATEEDRCSIAVVRGGTILGEWIIRERPGRTNNGAPVQLSGEYISGYFRDVIPAWTGLSGDLPDGGYPGPTSTPPGVGEDPLKIAYDLVAQCADPITSTTAPAGSRGLAITLPSRSGLSSGQLVTQTDWATQTNDVLSMLTTLQQTWGFDWAVDVGLSGLAVVRTLTLSYPQRGTNQAITILMPEQGGQGGQVSAYTANTGDRRATQIITTGSSANAGSTLVARSNNTALVAGYPLKQKINSQTSTTDPMQLQAQSDAMADYASTGDIPPQLTVLADIDPVLGSYTEGDMFPVSIGDSDNFPGGVQQNIRVIGIKIAPPKAGAEYVDLTVTLA